ncbi:hypothetical protein H6G41_29760 [Tolypothrix sp. FACHB-123]|nr:hypothetical protein [Tolypothrix sp. FACHB-123]
MPAKDLYHDTVVQALINDGWEINVTYTDIAGILTIMNLGEYCYYESDV